MPNYLASSTDLFSLRLSNNKSIKVTISVRGEWIKTIPMLLSDHEKIYFLVCHRILVISLYEPWGVKGCKSVVDHQCLKNTWKKMILQMTLRKWQWQEKVTSQINFYRRTKKKHLPVKVYYYLFFPNMINE